MGQNFYLDYLVLKGLGKLVFLLSTFRVWDISSLLVYWTLFQHHCCFCM